MRTVRIILGILFAVVTVRGIELLGQGSNGNVYPVAAIVAGAAGCLVLIFVRKGKRGSGEG